MSSHQPCCTDCRGIPHCVRCRQLWPCPTVQLDAAQATIAQRDAQVAEWQREYVDQGQRFSAATGRQIDTFKRLVREKIELREQLAARDAQVAELTAALARLLDAGDQDRRYSDRGSWSELKAAKKQANDLLARTSAAPEGEADAQA